ncbi:MAG: serine hydrolase, partial [Pyrinomonadaceae bacterium]
MKRKKIVPVILIGILGWAQFSAGQPSSRIKRVKNVPLRVESAVDLTIVVPHAHLTVLALLNSSTNGKTGFYLKRVGGDVLIGNDSSFAFYPASTIKVLEHLHAMRRVQSGSVSLESKINIWGDSCADDHSDEEPQAKEKLSDSLRLMMKESNNQRTNAIQDRFGRTAINNTGHGTAGMSASSSLNHKFGCQGPASPLPNRLTLADVGKIYEGVANGTLLTGTSRNSFYELMKNETDAFFIGSVINE